MKTVKVRHDKVSKKELERWLLRQKREDDVLGSLGLQQWDTGVEYDRKMENKGPLKGHCECYWREAQTYGYTVVRTLGPFFGILHLILLKG